VLDVNIGATKRCRDLLSQLNLEVNEYINSGVLIFRPKHIHRDLLSEFITFIDDRSYCMHPDQDFLNFHFKGRIEALDGRFNCQITHFKHSALKLVDSYHGKVLHYSGKLKPLLGYIFPAVLPFWVHSYLVPELSAYFNNKELAYIFPVIGQQDRLKKVNALKEFEYKA